MTPDLPPVLPGKLIQNAIGWKSIAWWPYPSVDLGDEENKSEDKHPSKLCAEAVCRRLETKGYGGDGKIFPLRTSVEPIYPEEPIARANGIGGEESLVGKHGEFTAKRVTYQCVVTEEIDKDFMPGDVVVTYIRDGEKIEGARIPRSAFRPNPTSNPCESVVKESLTTESPKPDEVKSRTPIMDAAIAQGWQDKRDFLNCIGTLESDLAAARSENEKLRIESEKWRTKFLTQRDEANSNTWIWMGDGEDYPESLSCPVIMSADQLREFVAAKESEHRLRAALEALLRYAERHTCLHEETHREGSIWEVCDSCRRRWADDEGGKPDGVHEWPKEIADAQDALFSEAALSPASSGKGEG